MIACSEGMGPASAPADSAVPSLCSGGVFRAHALCGADAAFPKDFRGWSSWLQARPLEKAKGGLSRLGSEASLICACAGAGPMQAVHEALCFQGQGAFCEETAKESALCSRWFLGPKEGLCCDSSLSRVSKALPTIEGRLPLDSSVEESRAHAYGTQLGCVTYIATSLWSVLSELLPGF